jgi:dienelactone hydrolase
VLAAFKAEGVTSVGAVGYCYSARWVFDLAFDGAITAAVVAHPSLLQVPADLEVCLLPLHISIFRCCN